MKTLAFDFDIPDLRFKMPSNCKFISILTKVIAYNCSPFSRGRSIILSAVIDRFKCMKSALYRMQLHIQLTRARTPLSDKPEAV